ncbi:hypothetical protein [Nostoc sp. NZL]|uniref:hypothetical protein n=1 Tax=Nostoc sp. NZL TaxID=2650612 RepID=UPI001E461E62|nr:hypothetical protein [Nostoc sp. NZL]
MLILDNAETILHSKQPGQWRSGYEAYGQWLRMMGEMPHQSCCLLTSRENPQEIAILEGERSMVRSLPLSGLTQDDGRGIFRQRGICIVWGQRPNGKTSSTTMAAIP